jgi:RNA polymerase sigma-70 factor (ECF subfamily)
MAPPDTGPTLGLVETIDAESVPNDELVRQLAEGRESALDALHERYKRSLTSLAARQLGRAAAQDVVQDVFVSVWRHAQDFDARRGTFRRWVVQITRRRIINELRRRRSQPQAEADPDGTLLDKVSDGVPDIADQLVNFERRSAVRSALEILSQPQREAIVLAFLDEFTHEEVARTLRIPLGTTKTRIRSGLLKLRVELIPSGIAA